uniref:Transporter n=1 Tax=Pygocentrus nattereri TaxID=42514 RepID=A0AAR2INN9_PYGNA
QEEMEGKIEDRGHWASKAEFLLAVAGHVVGIGNLWRFPYLCYKNGGGAFLVPYVVFVLTCGIPLFLLETAMGQYTQQGGITCWHRICPLAQGVGYAGQILQIYGRVYMMILAWALFYLVFSFSSQLPWASCDNSWNTAACNVIGGNLALNRTGLANSTSAATEFWERRVLSISTGIDDVGKFSWELFLCLLAVWIICYFCVWKGIKSSGKVVYFTATFPYVMLLVLLVRGLTLPGALQGIVFYVYPDLQRLLDPQVWMEAGTQVYYSYSTGVGVLTVLGSYNTYNNNCYRDCFMLCLLNSCTSIVAGFAVFSTLGFMAHECGKPIQDVAESGPGLGFIAYPQAAAMIPLPQLWAVCFFIMLILLCVDTQFVALEAIITSMTDVFPRLLRKTGRRELFLLFFCLICFFSQLIMVSEAGMYWFQLIDYYASSGACILFLAIFQSVAIGWIFGAERLCDVIEDMTGSYPNFIFRLCWKYITPLVSMVTFIYYLVDFKPLKYNRRYMYPGWAYALGWLLVLSSILMVPGWALGGLWTVKGSLRQRWLHLCSPDENLPLTQKQRAKIQDVTSAAEMEDLMVRANA